ncbi:MAG TPA: class I SAM-dependent methyltransferase [Actinophytocola sp.]|uniref:class I SAM-dependent methyltransferase n=1 Tax=Actinophytocola sp. TaxID=1872138 RepID=UPI002DBED259|nr:class I SAM-dependent methyltransferase [Actinophytocola sp.]HEU5472495.1 class I SAM-dependent methyltransferase [Actinophytocola sp.]
MDDVESPVMPDPEWARRAATVFDALGSTYEQTYSRNPEHLAAIDWLLARLPAEAKVMDIGSGTGRPTAELLAAVGHQVTGYDVSTTMVDLARRQVPAARFEVADVRTLSETPQAWDAITAFFPLLMMSRKDIADTLTRMTDWLAPGGLLMFATAPFDAEDTEFPWMGQLGRYSSYPAEVYPQLLREAGLEILHERRSVFEPDFPGMSAEEHQFLYTRKPLRPAT